MLPSTTTAGTGTPGGGVWECRNCRTRNIRRLARCALCDCINPDSLSPMQPSPVHVHVERSPTQALPVRTPQRNGSPSPRRDIVVDVRPVTTPNKPNDALLTLQSQLSQAVAAHHALMQEYGELNNEYTQSKGTIDRLRGDLKFLDGLYQQGKRQQEDASTRLQERERMWDEEKRKLERQTEELKCALQERDATIETKRRELHSVLEQRDAFALQHESLVLKERADRSDRERALAEENAALLRQLEVRKKDISLEMDACRDVRDREASEFQRLLRDMAATHDQAMKRLSEEVASTKGLSAMLASAERQMLMERVEHEQRMRLESESFREKESAAAKEEIDRLRAASESLAKQRDELLMESKFQLEIVSELRMEKANLKSEVAALRLSAEAASPMPSSTWGTTRDVMPSMSLTATPPAKSLPAIQQPSVSLQELTQLQEQVRQCREELQSSEHQRRALQDELDIKEDECRELHLEVSQLSRKLSAAEEKLKRLSAEDEVESPKGTESSANRAKDEEIAECNKNISALQDALDDEEGAHQECKKRVEELETALHTQAEDARRRTEQLNRTLQEQQNENGKLVEECDALRIACNDMEQVLADALAQQHLDEAASQ